MARLFRSRSCGLVGSIREKAKKQRMEHDGESVESCPSSMRFATYGKNRHHPAVTDTWRSALWSLATCSLELEDASPFADPASGSDMEISWPTNVQHVSHVTFDRFNGFIGLPPDLQPQVPTRAPSASVKVFGVSASSMQCEFDDCGNSVPLVLLMLQKRLYSEGGLKEEGIFRINGESSLEASVREKLSDGVVPHGTDVHCLAGLIKAWFRELPGGLLDSLTPQQVSHCSAANDDYRELIKWLPQTEGELLNWAVNLMADVVENQENNKMNAHNIAMVFAPNLTQISDPLIAVKHVVDVMKLLKSLITSTVRDRENANSKFKSESFSSCESFQSFLTQPLSSPATSLRSTDERVEYGSKFDRGKQEKSGFREGVKRLCRHPVFQLSKSAKKHRGEAWA